MWHKTYRRQITVTAAVAWLVTGEGGQWHESDLAGNACGIQTQRGYDLVPQSGQEGGDGLAKKCRAFYVIAVLPPVTPIKGRNELWAHGLDQKIRARSNQQESTQRRRLAQNPPPEMATHLMHHLSFCPPCYTTAVRLLIIANQV